MTIYESIFLQPSNAIKLWFHFKLQLKRRNKAENVFLIIGKHFFFFSHFAFCCAILCINIISSDNSMYLMDE